MVMRKFKMMKDAKEHIDQVWEKITVSMVNFMRID